jgi:transcriptional regulator with XRE-family HTH domain
MTSTERFAVNLRRLRSKAGISQEELARRCDLHRTEISLLERAGRGPRLGTLAKLGAALDAEPNEFLEGVEWNVGQGEFVAERPAKT